ncbi:SDR family NAD(P)-dependent oxidoreductase [Defluviimonas salinarum]|uniref:SDR family oxidoreductase n=1 Tax=Defluviimonas salinarum TaxID=2992147 RepID=A0ABT3J7I7_9RHOB|nr:SDR family oxidoreductase [Defluviimonas salinarum]MCW3783626.1 SDR family oxidoreductase [Defluviimonas salinarum]
MADGRFDNKVVMITGAASGFGAIAVRRFAAEGARLALSDIAAAGTPEGAEAIVDRVDVTDEAQVAAHAVRTIERFGRIDIAINNAGAGQSPTPLQDMSLDTFERVLAINARGVFLGMKYQLPGMIENRAGVILNIASVAGLRGSPQMSAYLAAKHAVVGLTKAAACEVAHKGIRVNALCPFFAATPMAEEFAANLGARRGGGVEEGMAQLGSGTPMRRVGRPEEIVQAMLWLCDPVNSYTTGQSIAIDGGKTAI